MIYVGQQASYRKIWQKLVILKNYLQINEYLFIYGTFLLHLQYFEPSANVGTVANIDFICNWHIL